MAVSTIGLPVSQKQGSGNIRSGLNWYRRGNVVMVSFSNIAISDTSDKTLLGAMPSDLKPPIPVYSSGFAAGNVSYGLVDSSGNIYGYRQTAGNLTVTVVYGVI